MAGRADNSENYRYGFNGMEKDKEFTNSTSHYDFGARIYDSRLGRWLAVDAIMNQFPSFSPYCFSNNSPISFIDLEGEIPLLVINYQTKTIIIYQPVFVVTSGPGAYTQAEVKSMNNDVNSYINADQFGAEVDGEGGWTYNLTFIFYEGGTITEAEKKANESGQVFGAYIPATLEQHISITDFNNSLLRLKPNNKVNPNTAAGVCYRSTNISINKVLSRINELWVLTHELFHALFSKDNEGGITQYPMNNGGKMDKVNQKNLQDATDRALDWFSNVVIVTEEGSVINDFGIGTQDLSLLPKDIKLYDKNKAYENKRNNYGNGGSGMGALHQSQLEEEIELSF
jgi:RHS repeat-associated protein